MTSADSFEVLMARFHTDVDTAARDVFRRFSGRLIALTRQQIAHRLAHRIDPEDVVQSAFRSFFVRQRDGKFDLGGWSSVWGLLIRITLRKCADRVEYLQAERRDVRRDTLAPNGDEQPLAAVPARTPSPEEAAVLSETIEALFRALDADERPILELSLQGHTAAEISIRLGRALRSVHRLRERIQKHLWRLHDRGGEG